MPTDTAMRSAHSVAAELCRSLEEEHIDYALLGDACVPSVPAAHRIELVVTHEALRDLPLVLHKFCQHGDAKLVMRTRNQRHGWRYVLSWLNRGERPEFLHVEAFADFTRKGRLLVQGQDLLRDRRFEPAHARTRSSFFVAAPRMEFIYYLLRCIHDDVLCEEQAQHLQDCWQRDPPGAQRQVERVWNRGGADATAILEAARTGEWSTLRMRFPELRSGLRPRVHLLDWLYGFQRRAREWWRPTGLLLACLGPEGVGKASVIGALKDRPLAPFRNVHTMEMRPRVFRSRRKPTPLAERRAPRGRVATMAKLMMFAIDYWFGYYWQIRPRLVRTMLVVSNRYYDDVLVDHMRYRMARPFAFARALLPWIPRPDLWLVLDAPPEVITSRGGAMPVQESSRQRREYRRMLKGYENVVLLDARQPLDRLVAQAERAIVAYLEDRTAEQLGLPRAVPKNPLSTRVLLFFCRRNVPLLSRLTRILFNSDIYCRQPAALYMPHPYGIVIQAQAVIGDRVTVMQQVAIGDKDQAEGVAPVIGNDVYIGAGARVLGDVRIGDGVTIGANAVVTQDVPAGVTVVGANRIVNAPANFAASEHTRPVTPFPVGMQRGA